MQLQACRVVMPVALVLFLSGYAEAQPTKVQLDVLKSAKTAIVIVEEHYDELQGVHLPFDAITRNLLEQAGVKVVQGDIQSADLVVKIVSRGAARSADYEGLGKQYSGALLSGTVSWEVHATAPYVRSFRGSIDPPLVIQDLYTDASNAPFSEAFQAAGSFVPIILETVRQLYGTAPLLSALVRWKETELASLRAHIVPELLGSGDSVGLQIALMNDGDFRVRASAAESLGPSSDLRAVPHLIEALKDENWQVRSKSARALGKLGDERAVEPLVALLRDELRRSRSVAGAASALGTLRDARAIEPLIDCLKEGDHFAVFDCRDALRQITGQRFSEYFEPWAKWWQGQPKAR